MPLADGALRFLFRAVFPPNYLDAGIPAHRAENVEGLAKAALDVEPYG